MAGTIGDKAWERKAIFCDVSMESGLDGRNNG